MSNIVYLPGGFTLDVNPSYLQFQVASRFDTYDILATLTIESYTAHLTVIEAENGKKAFSVLIYDHKANQWVVEMVERHTQTEIGVVLPQEKKLPMIMLRAIQVYAWLPIGSHNYHPIEITSNNKGEQAQ